MTISSSVNKVIYTANGVLTDFDFTFKTRNASDIQVYLDDVLQGSGYTVVLNSDQETSPGGTVTFDVAPADQTIVTIVREVPLTQEVDYQPYDPFPAETHEGALDKLTQITQQQQEELDRATKASVSDDGTTDYTLPLYDAGKAIIWDDPTKQLINSDDKINGITDAAQQSADDSAVSASAADSSATDSSEAAGISASWAQKTDGIVEAIDYSSKAYAIGGTGVTGVIGASKEWAITAEDTEVITGEYSALHWAKKAAAAASSQVNPNLIINGGFDVWQRGTSFAAIASGKYAADRFYISYSGVFVGTVARDTDTLDGSGHSYGVTITTPDAAIAAGDYCLIQQPVEGLNVKHLLSGKAGAKTVTISFDVKSPVTGTHCVALGNSAADRNYIVEYTVDAADTWERKSVTLTLDTTGTWLEDNGIGLRLIWTLAAGSTFQGAADTWQAGNLFATSNQVNAIGTVSDKFLLDNVKLEEDSVATDYVPRSYGEELALCQRYYFRPSDDLAASGQCYSTTRGAAIFQFPVTMRADPTLQVSLSAASGMTNSGGGVVGFSSLATSITRTTHGRLDMNVTSATLVAGDGTFAFIAPSDYVEFDAEL